MQASLREIPLVLLVASTGFWNSSALGQSYEVDGNVFSTSPGTPTPQAAQEAVRAYWTEERMRSAQPRQMVLEGSPSPQSARSSHFPTGTPTAGNSGLQGEGHETVLQGDDVRAVLGITGALATDPVVPQAAGDGVYTYPPPQTTYAIPVTWYGSFPLRAVGKLYFSLSGVNYVCSGAVIQTSSNDVIQTAGHCVSDGAGNWATNVLFKPAHRPAWDAPYGTWTARALGARNAWHNNGENGGWCEDLGCVILNTNGSGQHIGEVVGELGYVYDAGRQQHWHLFGYPAENGWSGDVMVVSATSWNLDDSPACVSGPNTLGVGWGLSGGASGGPWVLNYKPQQAGSNNYINGVSSYVYNDQPEQIYGPYFGAEFASLRDYCEAQ